MRVQGLGFLWVIMTSNAQCRDCWERVQGFEANAWDLGFSACGLRVWGSGFKALGSRAAVGFWGSGFEGLGLLGFRVRGFRAFGVQGSRV